jgi:hypothetical protein
MDFELHFLRHERRIVPLDNLQRTLLKTTGQQVKVVFEIRSVTEQLNRLLQRTYLASPMEVSAGIQQLVRI